MPDWHPILKIQNGGTFAIAVLWTNTAKFPLNDQPRELMRLKLPFTAVERQELIFLSLSLCLSLMWFIGMLLYGGVAQAVNDIMNNGCHSSIKHLAWFSPDAVPDLKTSCAGDTSQNPVLFRQNPISVVFASYITQYREMKLIGYLREWPPVGNDTPICSHLNVEVIPLFKVMLPFQTTKVGF